MTVELRKKIIGIPLQKAISKQTDGSLLVRGFFTSDSRDEVGDIITRAATERAVPKYRQWGNIRYMHQPRPVGRVTRIGQADGLAWNEVEIKVIDPQAVFEVENGLLQALSVGILVNIDDVNLMVDGGWVINDYQLAEISLVDHPANYDATLNLSLDEALRTQVRENGLVPTLRSLGISIRGDKSMETEVITAAVDAVVEPVVEEVAAPIVEVVATPVVDAVVEDQVEPVVAPVEEVAPVAAEVVAVEASLEEVAPVVEDEPVVAPVAEVVEPAIVSEFAQLCNALTATVEGLNKALAAFSIPAAVEQPKISAVKALEATEQPVAGKAEDEVADLKVKNAALQARVTELSTPVDRKGALPVEPAPVAELVAAEKSVEPTDLRTAVQRFMLTRQSK